MKISKKKIVILLSLLLLIICLLYIVSSSSKVLKSGENNKESKLELFDHAIEETWLYGEYEKFKNMLEDSSVNTCHNSLRREFQDVHFQSCNPFVLGCYLSRAIDKNLIKGYSIDYLGNRKFILKIKYSSFYERNDFKLLNSNCREIKLNSGNYSILKDQVSFKFDGSLRSISVDMYPSLYIDYLSMQKSINDSNIDSFYKAINKKIFLDYSDVKSIKDYCSQRGGSLLKEYEYYMISSHHIREHEYVLYPYSWTRKRVLDYSSLEDSCYWVYTKECLDNKMDLNHRSASSDHGAFLLHGRLPGVVDKIIYKENSSQEFVNLSSYYFNLSSEVHKVWLNGRMSDQDIIDLDLKYSWRCSYEN